MEALAMAKMFGPAASTLSTNCFRYPFLAHNNNRIHQLVIAAVPRFHMPPSLATSPRGITYVCRSQMVVDSSISPPGDSDSKLAFISVYDKTDLNVLASGLRDLGYTIVSTGETFQALEKAGIPVAKVEDISDFPGIIQFDIEVVNEYPFYDNVSSSDEVTFQQGLEHVEVSGPSDYLTVADPRDYLPLLEYLEGNRQDQNFRKMLALKALHHATADHDSHHVSQDPAVVDTGGLIGRVVQHHGKPMSIFNLFDAEEAWDCVCEFVEPKCVVAKEMKPCGVASRDDIIEAYKLAIGVDSASSYGGIAVAFNVEVDEALAQQIREYGERKSYEVVVVAPGYSQTGLDILRGSIMNLKVIEAKRYKRSIPTLLRELGGGLLEMEWNEDNDDDIQFQTVSEKFPSENEFDDIKFAWICAKHLQDNAIVIAKNKCTLGMGSHQPTHLDCLRTAMEKAGEEVKGAIVAADGFVPFVPRDAAWNDVVEEACKSGVAAIVEPGGSVRDGDAIDCCNRYNVSLAFSGVGYYWDGRVKA